MSLMYLSGIAGAGLTCASFMCLLSAVRRRIVAYQLQRKGVQVRATITKRWKTFSSQDGGSTFYLDYKFTKESGNGKTRDYENTFIDPPVDFYKSSFEGQGIEVLHLSFDPSVNMASEDVRQSQSCDCQRMILCYLVPLVLIFIGASMAVVKPLSPFSSADESDHDKAVTIVIYIVLVFGFFTAWFFVFRHRWPSTCGFGVRKPQKGEDDPNSDMGGDTIGKAEGAV